MGVLVTSEANMLLAPTLFERGGVPIAPFPVDFQFAATEGFSIFEFIPNGASLNNTESAVREIYGNINCRVFHRKARRDGQ